MNYKTILRWLPKPLIIGLLFSMAFTGLAGIVMAEVMGYVADFTRNNTPTEVIVFLIISMGVFLVIYSMFALNIHFTFLAIKILNTKLKRKYLLSEMQNKVFDKNNTGKVSILLNDFKLIEEKYFTLIFQVFFNLAISIFTASYLFYLDIYLGTVFIILSFLAFLPARVFEGALENRTNQWTVNSSDFLQKAKDFLQGMNVIKIYQAENEVKEKTFQSLNRAELSLKEMKYMETLITHLSICLSSLGRVVPIIFGLLLILEGRIEASLVITMNVASSRVSYPFEEIAEFDTQMKSTKEIRKRTMSFLGSSKKDLPESVSSFLTKPQISVKNITFAYTKEKPLINNASMNIIYGEKVLITGKSGSGKTTLLDLIQGIKEVTNGEVVFADNFEEREIRHEDSSSLFARIDQSPFLFSEDLAFNLSLGKDYTDEQLKKVLRRVELMEELGEKCLYKNYGENGSELSGGQRQRIEIARALLHDKPILLVDEATAALDSETAKKIRNILWRLPQTVIEIAHHYEAKEVQYYRVKQYDLENGQLSLRN